MKLYVSPTSPYARKCRIAAREKLITRELQEVTVNPWGDDVGELRAANPLGKVPALAVAGGDVLFDSRVICAYFDGFQSGARLIPEGDARFRVLRTEALVDGMFDCGVGVILESRRPPEQQSETMKSRWIASIERAVPEIAASLPRLPADLNLGHISIGVGLAYLDFRFPQIDWRAGSAELAAWYEDFRQRPSMQETAPPPA